MAPVVELHDIHHSYGAVETLRAVSFSFDRRCTADQGEHHRQGN